MVIKDTFTRTNIRWGDDGFRCRRDLQNQPRDIRRGDGLSGHEPRGLSGTVQGPRIDLGRWKARSWGMSMVVRVRLAPALHKVGNELWVSRYGARRIAGFPMK